MAMKRWMVTADRDSVRTIRLALRWMLILATAMLLTPPGSGRHPQPFDTLLILAFASSNVALTLLPRVTIRSRNLEYLTVISDTFLVALALFRAGLDQVHLPLVFFLTLLLAALGPDLPRMIAGTTALAAFYLVLTWRGITGSPEAMETYSMSEKKVVHLVEESGGKVLCVEDNQNGPPGWQSRKYFCVRPCPAD